MRYRAFSALILLGVSACAAEGFASPIRFDTAQVTYAGRAVPLETGGVRLTDKIYEGNDSTPPAGAVWTTEPVMVAWGFEISFAFRMSDGWGYEGPDGKPLGGDGLAFVIQNYGNTQVGRGAGGLGYMNIYNSLAVEFDSYWNAPWYGDPDGNHISVQSRGMDFNVPHHKCTDGALTVPDYPTDLPGVPCTADPSLGSVPVGSLLNNGEVQTAKITYEPGSLSVYLNTDLMLTVPVQLDTLLYLEDGQSAYIGFTAGTRYAYQNHDILWADFEDPPPPGEAPEPATWVLLLSGLGAAALLRRTRSVK